MSDADGKNAETADVTKPQAQAASAGTPPAVRGANVPATERVDGPHDGEIVRERRSLRRFVLPLVVLAALGFGAKYGYGWFVEGRFFVGTDDAYVKADTSIIAAKVAGYVATVPVIDNEHVEAGEVLARIDPGDYQLAVDAARGKMATQKATIERLVQQSEAQKPVIAQAQAQVEAAQADMVRTQAAFDRAEALANNNFGSKATVDQTRGDRDRAVAMLASTRAAVDTAKSALDVMAAQKAEAERELAELATALAQAQRNLEFTEVKAPFSGVVGNRAAQPGQYVQPGTRLMALVPIEKAFVEANFKETQIASLKPGQKVRVTVDAYSHRMVEGTVESIAPASGSQFSLLPPENATGNFTKIVQRVPVRISIDNPGKEVLRPGLSVVVDVDTRDPATPAPTLFGALGFTR